MFVTALEPPGNILAAVQKVKVDLFSALGFASLYALPAIIPIAYSTSETPAPASHAIIRQSAPIGTTSLGVSGRFIVIGIADPSVVGLVTDQVALPPEPAVDAPFPVVPAIFLCEYETVGEKAGAERMRSLLDEYRIERLTWKRSELVCFEFIPGSETWWNCSSLSYRWRRTLKLPKRQRR